MPADTDTLVCTTLDSAGGPSGLYDEGRLPLDLSEGRAVQRGEHPRGAGPLRDEVLSPGQRRAFGDQAETSEQTVEVLKSSLWVLITDLQLTCNI